MMETAMGDVELQETTKAAQEPVEQQQQQQPAQQQPGTAGSVLRLPASPEEEAAMAAAAADAGGEAERGDVSQSFEDPALQTDLAKKCANEHMGSSRQYMRDMILGVNDGLVSIFLLVFGVVGGGLDTRGVLLAGITGAVAGAISMALGEFMATRSQTEVMESELKLEREHLMTNRPAETAELRGWLRKMGLRGDVLRDATEQVCARDKTMLEAMKIFEFGMVDSEERSAVVAMFVSGCVFIAGSLPAWLPFAFVDNNTDGLIASGVLSAAGLFFVGFVKTFMTRGHWFRAGMENTVIGLAGAGVSYAVGLAYDSGAAGKA